MNDETLRWSFCLSRIPCLSELNPIGFIVERIPAKSNQRIEKCYIPVGKNPANANQTYNTIEGNITLSDIASSGLRVVRIVGFIDWNTLRPTGKFEFQRLNATRSVINTGADRLHSPDYVISPAEQNGLELIILFVNNWADFGGVNAYVAAVAAQARYCTYIKAVVSRYINSTAIFAWKLASGPRCARCDTSVIVERNTGVSQYIKPLDPNHLVALEDEGLGLSTGDGSYPYTNVLRP